MKRTQSGFTLIEIAIVLVIIGLLLGGVVKGQELISGAKVKNLAADFKNVPLFIYGYQDKFKTLPGDDVNAVVHVSGVPATSPTASLGNGSINGGWDSNTSTDESIAFWQHVRLSGLAVGPTAIPVTLAGDQDPYLPQNAVGGRIGIESSSANPPIANMKGTYIVCSKHILGKFAKQLDITLDDGVSNTGSLLVTADAPSPASHNAAAIATPDDDTLYTVCQSV